jgi:membrane protease YdiL (CAAX protease family)
MPNALDVLLVLAFAVLLPLYSHFTHWPRHVRSVEAGDPRARSRVYVRTLIEEWLLVAAAAGLMVANARPFSAIWLVPPSGWRLVLGVGLLATYVALILLQSRAIGANPKALTRLRAKLQPLRALIPHTPGELRLFVPLAITAGFCEEFLFRGYLVWVLQLVMGLYPAAVVSMVLFGLGHGYQGGKFGLRAFWVGVAIGVLALVTRSLLPGMALHAAIDLGSGWITYVAMSRGAEPGAAGPESASAPPTSSGSLKAI